MKKLTLILFITSLITACASNTKQVSNKEPISNIEQTEKDSSNSNNDMIDTTIKAGKGAKVIKDIYNVFIR